VVSWRAMPRTRTNRVSRRSFLETFGALTVSGPYLLAKALPTGAIVLENADLRYVIGAGGRNLSFIDKRTGRDYCSAGPQTSFLTLKKAGKTFTPSACALAGHRIIASFKSVDAEVACAIKDHGRYFTIEVEAVRGQGIEELRLLDLRLTGWQQVGHVANLVWNDQFGIAVMALNLQTNAGLDGRNPVAELWASCYPKFGLQGAKVALAACATSDFRGVLKRVVSEVGFVQSDLGGAWALDAPENRDSYLFAYISEQNVDDWIALAKSGGFRTLLLSEIGPYGHYDPHPKEFPHGLDGVRQVVGKIHSAGLLAGWHMLSFIIQKDDPWASPAPHPGLAVRSTLTLAGDISQVGSFVPTVESPEGLPVHSGYWFRGGMDILVDGEILKYTGLKTSPPYGLTGCERGSYGTPAAAHKKGAALKNLQEVFGTYLPAPDSRLLDEMETRLAEIIRTCSFDMIYFDGLDGADAFAGPEWSWHYGPAFALSVFQRAGRRLQLEASSWYHHDWHVTSRLGAWDRPTRDPKRFLDAHVADNARLGDLLPTQLGWWALQQDHEWLGFATTPDVIEYFGAKCLGNGESFSLEEVSPEQVQGNARWQELVAILGRYERVRLGGGVSEGIKAKLRVPGREFKLIETASGATEFVPVAFDDHKVSGLDGWSNVWTVMNRFPVQQPRFRIRALFSAGPYEASGNIVVADFSAPNEFQRSSAARGISARWVPSTEQVKTGGVSGLFAAKSALTSRRGAWATVGKQFSPPVDLSSHAALGVWVFGDGKGEILNLQLLDIRGPGAAVGDHYVKVDFKGWRYFELIEPEAERWSDYVWPYGNLSALYREAVELDHVADLDLYLNNLPPGEDTACWLSPVKALEVHKARLENPRLTVGGKTIEFPVAVESGSYIEFTPPDQGAVFDPNGLLLQRFKSNGEVPTLESGENHLEFSCDRPAQGNPRVLVTLISSGPRIEA